MSDGLGNLDQCVVRQVFDPLEWCIPMLPCPSKLGLPCLPCDRPNKFQVFSCDNTFEQLGMQALQVQEVTSLKERILCCASNRAFQLYFEDFYGRTEIIGTKHRKYPYYNTQQLELHSANKYLGRIQQNQTCIQLSKNLYEEIDIYERNETVVYKITSELKQCGHCIIMPCMGCEQRVYNIYNCQSGFRDGYIQHVIGPHYNELCSKADQYHVQFPIKATETHKLLIVTATIFLDYLNYENL